MKFWKFNHELEAKEPSYIPTFEEVKNNYNDGYHLNFWNLFTHGIYRYAGWAFDFRDELKKFVVKTKDGDLYERWAPNRTLLRKCMHTRLAYILDAPK